MAVVTSGAMGSAQTDVLYLQVGTVWSMQLHVMMREYLEDPCPSYLVLFVCRQEAHWTQ